MWELGRHSVLLVQSHKAWVDIRVLGSKKLGVQSTSLCTLVLDLSGLKLGDRFFKRQEVFMLCAYHGDLVGKWWLH